MVDFIIVLIVAVLLLFALRSSLRRFSGRSTCCGDVRTGRSGEKHLDGPVIGSMRVRISGMECENCANRVKGTIDAIDGALASVDHKTGYATVSYDRAIDEASVRDAVRRAGYKVESIS